MAEEKELKSFKELGVNVLLAYSCDAVGWKNPTKIQVEAIPVVLEGKKDIIGIAQTGSGKTGAFAIPILQALPKTPCAFPACVLSPTRELAIRVAEQFEALGPHVGLRCAVLVDGADDFAQQSKCLKRNPHVVVATPGRLVDHLCKTKGFSFRSLKFLVLDEADRLLNDHFELVEEILNVTPPELRIYLFSATMTNKVKKLQRAWLTDPVMIKAGSKYTLRQQVQEAKGISQMKTKEGGRKRKCDEDDARNRQASEKKHHPGPRSRPPPLTELGKKLKDKLEELSLAANPKQTCVEVHGNGSFSYKLIYPNGVTMSAYICGDDESDEEDDPGPTEEWATGTLPSRRSAALPSPPYGSKCLAVQGTAVSHRKLGINFFDK